MGKQDHIMPLLKLIWRKIYIMKILSKYCLILLSFAILLSCNKTNDNPATESKTNAVTNAIAASPSTQVGLKSAGTIRCLGPDCDNSQGTCGIIWDIKAGTVECSCTGCRMEIASAKEMQVFQEMIEKIGPSFERLLLKEIGKSNTKIKEFKMEYDEINKVNLLTIEYKISENEEKYGTVLYASYTNDSPNQKVGTVEIDCKGTCDCRERWVVATGSAECTCTDNCKMTVTTVN
jgi:hypothetical protein